MNKHLTLSVGLLAFSCAHNRDVLPSETGLHSVILQTERKNEKQDEAMSEANHYCGKSGKKASKKSEQYEYQGKTTEESYNSTHDASTAAKAVGYIGSVSGSDAGGTVLAGGRLGSAIAGQGYKYTMKFTCE